MVLLLEIWHRHILLFIIVCRNRFPLFSYVTCHGKMGIKLRKCEMFFFTFMNSIDTEP